MKRTVIDKLEIVSGSLQVRMKKQNVVDGETIEEGFHRVSISPEMDVENVLAQVNDHLERLLEAGPVASDDWQRVRDAVAGSGLLPQPPA